MSSARPLSDIRVLDLSRLLPGPFATLVLADLGATVDKIEDPGQGDYLRHMPPQVAGQNVAFAMLNRGKRSAVLDLKSEDGRRALAAMIASYDVLFEQFRPGVLARLGLSPEALREQHPRLIVCSLSGYGQTGPLAQRAGHDLNYLARAGLLDAQGPTGGAPQVPGFQLADISGSLWSVTAILAALRHRDRTGEGAWLDIALSEGTLPFALTSLGPALCEAPRERGDEQLTGGIAPYQVYQAKDGGFITLAALEPKFWLAFAASFGLSPQMSDLVQGPHQVDLKQRVAEIVRSRTVAEWGEYAAANDVPIEPVLAMADLKADPHLRARGVFFELGADRLPQLKTPVSPAQVADATPPPAQGEHTRVILEQAGLDAGAVAALFASGAAR